MAYANNRMGIDVPETEIVTGRLIQMNPIDLFMQTHPEIGLCFYDLHNDGSGRVLLIAPETDCQYATKTYRPPWRCGVKICGSSTLTHTFLTGLSNWTNRLMLLQTKILKPKARKCLRATEQ